MNAAVETVEVSPGSRRIARGVLHDLEAPEGETLRPFARALIDLAVSIMAEDDEEETA
jgi:hypothetical protein